MNGCTLEGVNLETDASVEICSGIVAFAQAYCYYYLLPRSERGQVDTSSENLNPVNPAAHPNRIKNRPKVITNLKATQE
jgi:hypothetical protein